MLGSLRDFISKETVEDTHDERYRQKLARLLVNKKGYEKEDVTPRVALKVKAGHSKAIVKVDFVVTLLSRVCMVIKYGPGSIVTRQQPALALSRIIVPYQIPVVVVTNGEDAQILNGATGRELDTGFAGIPSRQDLAGALHKAPFTPVSDVQAEMAARIVYAFEVDGSCPCDDSIYKL